MPNVILESPFKGTTPKVLARNVFYARLCMRDCLDRGEAPFASHLLYTQPHILDDTIQEDRAKGISAGLAWGKHADYIVVYTDLGISGGMQSSIEIYKTLNIHINYRVLKDWEELWSLKQLPSQT